MKYYKIITVVLFMSSYALFAQVQEPIKNDKKANTSSSKPLKSNQTTGAKPMKTSTPTKSVGLRTNKSTQTK